MKFLTDLLGRKPVDLGCKVLPQRAKYIELTDSKTITVAGETLLLQSTGNRIEIYDLIVQVKASTNTFQLFAGNRPETGLLEFTADQAASFGEINLHWPDRLTIVLANATPVVVSYRYRIYQ
jgi:hypothetical protein